MFGQGVRPQRNYLGIERSAFLVGKAVGLSRRYGLDGFLHFVAAPAELALRWLHERKAVVELLCVNFPTPFAEESSRAHGKTEGSEISADDDGSGGVDAGTASSPAGTAAVAVASSEFRGCAEQVAMVVSDAVGVSDAGGASDAVGVKGAGGVCDDAPRLSDTSGFNTHLPTKAQFILSDAAAATTRQLLKECGGSLFVQVRVTPINDSRLS
jgi:hypothetical protein